jgi:hypothetical protein
MKRTVLSIEALLCTWFAYSVSTWWTVGGLVLVVPSFPLVSWKNVWGWKLFEAYVMHPSHALCLALLLCSSRRGVCLRMDFVRSRREILSRLILFLFLFEKWFRRYTWVTWGVRLFCSVEKKCNGVNFCDFFWLFSGTHCSFVLAEFSLEKTGCKVLILMCVIYFVSGNPGQDEKLWVLSVLCIPVSNMKTPALKPLTMR